MFNLFKKKPKKESVYSVADGQLIPITDVQDDVFSTKMLGDGYGINPSNSDVYAPVNGTITTLFPTKHAIGITTEIGVEILVHLGLDTVELKGKPFEVFIKEGDTVKVGQKIVKMDLEAIHDSGYKDTIIVVYTNMDKIKNVSKIDKKTIKHSELVQEFESNE